MSAPAVHLNEFPLKASSTTAATTVTTTTSRVQARELNDAKPAAPADTRIQQRSMFAIVATALVLQALGYAIWNALIYPNYFSPLRHLPTAPDAHFLLGNLHQLRKNPAGHPLAAWAQSIPNQGFIRYFLVFGSERLVPTNAKTLSEILVRKSYDFDKPVQYRVGLQKILGVGVLLAEGDEHKRQRRSLNPAFSFPHIKELYPTFWVKAREVTRSMLMSAMSTNSSYCTVDSASQIPFKQTQDAASTLEISSWANRTTLDVIGAAGLGQDFGAIRDPENPLFSTYRDVFSPSTVARIIILLSIYIPDWLLSRLPLKHQKKVQDAAQTIRATCHDIIARKQNKAALVGGKDILTVALNSGEFSDSGMVDQLMTFLAAGHETTASALTWAVHELCLNPGVQTRLREEVRSHLPSVLDDNTSITAGSIERLPYLQAVCNEVLRFHPPVSMTLRIANRDTSIQGQFVPKGTTIILSPHVTNKSEEFWGADAAVFNPERWLGPGRANSGGADSNYGFLTFLHGPRNCIGKGFAKAEMAVLLAAWVGVFEMSHENPSAPIEILDGVATSPKGGLKINVRYDGLW